MNLSAALLLASLLGALGTEDYIRPDARVAEVWLAGREATLLGDLHQIRQGLEEIHQWKLDSGIPNLFTVSQALVRAALKAERERDRDRTSLYLEYARKLSPNWLDVYLAESWIRLKHHPFEIVPSVGHAVKGVVQAAGSGVFAAGAMVHGVFLGLLGLSVFGVLVLIVLARRPVWVLAHWLSHALRLRMPALPLRVALGLLLAASILAGPGYAAAAVLFLVALLGDPRDRVAGAILAGLLAGLPQAGEAGVRWAAGLSSPRFLEAAAWRDGVAMDTSVRRVEQAWEVGGDILPEETMLLATSFKRRSDYQHAVAALESILGRNDLQTLVLNNLAGAKAALGDDRGAVALYRQAIAQAPERELYHYNVAQVLQRKLLMIEEGEREMAIAGQLNAEAVEGLIERSGTHPNRLAQDEIMPVRALMGVAKVEGDRLGPPQFAALWEAFMPRLPASYGTIAFGFLSALSLLMLPVMRGRTLPRPCLRCGAMACVWCPRARPDRPLCGECQTHYVEGHPLVGKADEAKDLEVAEHRRRQAAARLAATIVLPGTGHYAAGSTWVALSALAMDAAVVAAWLAPAPLFPPVTEAALRGLVWGLTALGCLTWLVCVIGITRYDQKAAL
ncbi:MAG: hypothetical protein HYY13_03060 [Nitrospirae bacterium]|nr:hypothetical protein [Nitrospirota bacterium]